MVNYLPFDNQGTMPTLTVDPSSLDIDPSTAGIQATEGSVVALPIRVRDDDFERAIVGGAQAAEKPAQQRPETT